MITYDEFLKVLNENEKEINKNLKDNKHYCYIAMCSDDTIYTGYAKNPIKRLYEHNFKDEGAKYTKKRRPIHLLNVFEFDTRSDAMKEEFRIKHLSKLKKLELAKRKN